MDADAGAWQAAGLYDPDAADADDGLGALRFLTSHGATLDVALYRVRRT